MAAETHSLVRKPAVAGMFYDGDAVALRAMVAGLLQQARQRQKATGSAPKALIVPHAGYIYSGAVAASAYDHLGDTEAIERVVLLGPAHRLAFGGLALPGADGFETPLGIVPLDRDAISRIEAMPQVHSLPAAHEREHSLEVQLPFLQVALGAFSLVPLVVGSASAEDVAEVLEELWGGDETLIVISTDLSHYHDYAVAQTMDRATSKAIEALDASRIDYDDACGRVPLAGLLNAARSHGLSAVTVDLRNSGDTAGPRNQVVGYGAYIVA
jgi:AmmeMemoRadiSam system protein B